MPSMIPLYALGGFLALMMTYVIFDEGTLATKIRKGLTKTFSSKENNSLDNVVYSGVLLLFLSIGGFLAWAISLVSLSTLSIFGVAFVSLLALSYVYTRYGQSGVNYDLMKTVLFTTTSFVFGALLFSINTFALENYGRYIFGETEIIGIWLIVNWIMMVLTNSPVLKPIHFLLNIIFLVPYFTSDYSLFGLLGLDYKISESILSFFFLPLVIFSMNALLYGWFQKRPNKELMESNVRNEYLLTGSTAFLTLGGVYVYGYFNYYDLLVNSLASYRLDYMFGLTTLWVFTVDYISKKIIKNYNANFLVPILIGIAGLTSFVFLPSNPFVPMLLTSIGFILYMMADYLRKGSPVTMLFFYFAMTVHLTIITFATDFWSLFLLVIEILILVYSSILHPKNKLFSYYVAIVIPLTLIFKFIGLNIFGFVILGLAGASMLFCRNILKDTPIAKKKESSKKKTTK